MTQETKFSASAPLAGYIFQCRLALLRGLQMAKTKANGHISIEKFDDVAFESADYSKCLLQAKHHIKPKSLDDMSVDVWKTLRIWVSLLKQGIISIGSTKLGLITTAAAKEGSAMALLRPGTSQKDRQLAFSLLCTAAEKSKNDTTKTARSEFLALSDAEAEALLAQIEVFDQHSNIIDVMTEIEGEIVLTAPNNASLAANYLEGWWLGVVGKCLVEDGSASIPVQNIITKANEIGKMFTEHSLPIDEPETLGVPEYSEDDEGELFVRQMRVIGMPDNIVKRGAEDYYRAYAQRSKWARESLLLDGEVLKYDRRIQDIWERKFDADVALSELDTDEKKVSAGRRVCFWASQQSISFRNVVETWITSGSYQGLSDRLEVGWHPDFATIFKVKNDGDGDDA